MTARFAKYLLASISLYAAACTGPQLTKSERLARELAQAYCQWQLNCCDDREMMALLGIPPDNDGRALVIQIRRDSSQCVELATAAYAAQYRRLAAAERADRAEIPDENYNACLSYYRNGAAACEIGNATLIGTEPLPCSVIALTNGLQTEGLPCSDDFECAEGLICRGTGTFGICGQPQTEGQSCTPDVPCAEEFYCSELTVAFCTDPNEVSDAFCDDSRDCSATMFCSTATGQCTPKRAPGESCELNAACSSGLCDPNSDTCDEPLALGTQCADDDQCGPGNHCDELQSNRPICAPSIIAQVGDRCDAIQVRCETGFACENGICVPGNGPGGWCDSMGAADQYCPPDQYCEANQCTPRKGVNEDCGDDGDCVETAFCNLARQCQARVPLAGTCSGTLRCVVDAYCDGTAHCAPTVGSGEDCANPDACGVDLFCTNTIGTCAEGLPLGSNCYRDGLCGLDGYCGDDPAADDVCAPFLVVAQGEGCNTTVGPICQDGLFCDFGTCQPRLNDNDPCSPVTTDPGCLVGSYCDQSTFECTPQVGFGDTCFQQQACPTGTYCDALNQCATRLAVDGDCTTDSSGFACNDGLYCNRVPTVDVCAVAPGDGQPCAPFTGNPRSRCATGFFCNGAVCEPRAAEGDPCTVNAACPTGTHECAAQRICLATRAAGELCDDPTQCNVGLACPMDGGVCRPRLAEGQPCDPGVLNVCVPFQACDAAAAVCMPIEIDQPAGEPCRFNTQCASQVCDRGLCIAFCVGP